MEEIKKEDLLLKIYEEQKNLKENLIPRIYEEQKSMKKEQQNMKEELLTKVYEEQKNIKGEISELREDVRNLSRTVARMEVEHGENIPNGKHNNARFLPL